MTLLLGVTKAHVIGNVICHICNACGFQLKMPRRKPFSNKQKKQQLQLKREKKKRANLGILYCSVTVSAKV